jgi:hypothetical protein
MSEELDNRSACMIAALFERVGHLNMLGDHATSVLYEEAAKVMAELRQAARATVACEGQSVDEMRDAIYAAFHFEFSENELQQAYAAGYRIVKVKG